MANDFFAEPHKKRRQLLTLIHYAYEIPKRFRLSWLCRAQN